MSLMGGLHVLANRARARARPARPGEPARARARRGGGPGDRAAAAAPRGNACDCDLCVPPRRFIIILYRHLFHSAACSTQHCATRVYL